MPIKYRKKKHIYFFFLALLPLTVSAARLKENKLTTYLSSQKISKSSITKIKKGSIVADTSMESIKFNQQAPKQSLSFFVIGLHPNSCIKSLRKLSLYENYANYIDFVKKSDFDEKSKKVSLTLGAKWLPGNFTLNFTLPRIHHPGSYPFAFDGGFLDNLKGTIYISQLKKKCLYSVKGSWIGKDTGINDSIFEFFSNLVLKIGLNRLFRVSAF